MKIVVCLTGGIALYKAAYVIRGLIKKGFEVKLVMTVAAEKFISSLTFSALVKGEVYTQKKWVASEKILHIYLADWADTVIVIPATANIIAKMAAGIADDLVSTTLLAADCPKYAVLAMNRKMLANPATQRNLSWLQENGVSVMQPTTGLLAEGEIGKGRLPEPPAILAWLKKKFQVLQDLNGKKVLVSAGPTVESIDPVRYLSNRSSGKMGYEIVQEAVSRGAKVTLISGPTNLTPPVGCQLVKVKTALEMKAALEKNFAAADYVVMAAAVADYRPAILAEQKIKKAAAVYDLKLIRNPDILAELGQKKQNQLLVGFAAETQQLLVNAQKKLQQKNADLLVANDVSRSDIGFGSSENEVTFLRNNQQPLHLAKTSKRQVAKKIFDLLLQMAKAK
jgi:phosphopantothenoylcysteine decarboxylase/phosphopantothenate--cysteine ligase